MFALSDLLKMTVFPRFLATTHPTSWLFSNRASWSVLEEISKYLSTQPAEVINWSCHIDPFSIARQ